MQPYDVREFLNRTLAQSPAGTPARQTAKLTDEEWEPLQEEGFVKEIQLKSPDAVTRALTFIQRMRLRKRFKRPRASKALQQHEKAVSHFLAADAERNRSGIDRFRQEVLNGRLLELEQVHDWIQQEAATDAARAQTHPPRLHVFHGPYTGGDYVWRHPTYRRLCVFASLKQPRPCARHYLVSYS